MNTEWHGAAVSRDDGFKRKSVVRTRTPADITAAAAAAVDNDDDDDAVGDVICCRSRDASSQLHGNRDANCGDVSKT